ncbi:MAG: hypothetical protein IPG72_12340 [Ardenticatenales bacterium]|jgi:hypothetical protein|nr:hypothetical protein [Ardenticatenales bacterium]
MANALILSDVFQIDPEAAAGLAALSDAGVQPLFVSVPGDGERPETALALLLVAPRLDLRAASDAPRAADIDDRLDALAEAAGRAGVPLRSMFFVAADPSALAVADAAGCRAVLVLGDRMLSDVLGPSEPDDKGFAVARDLRTAAAYIVDELAQTEALGAFPYDPHLQHEERARPPALTQRELVRVFVLVTVAGLAVSLALAFFLRELYENVGVPGPLQRPAFLLTLQFLPEWARGLLFLGLGAGLGAWLSRMLARAWPRRAGVRG